MGAIDVLNTIPSLAGLGGTDAWGKARESFPAGHPKYVRLGSPDRLLSSQASAPAPARSARSWSHCCWGSHLGSLSQCSTCYRWHPCKMRRSHWALECISGPNRDGSAFKLTRLLTSELKALLPLFVITLSWLKESMEMFFYFTTVRKLPKLKRRSAQI